MKVPKVISYVDHKPSKGVFEPLLRSWKCWGSLGLRMSQICDEN